MEENDLSTLEATLDHSYPNDLWGRSDIMLDLGPSEYSNLVDEIGQDADFAKTFLQGSAMGERLLKLAPGDEDTCNKSCRVRASCELNYGVNEQALMCMGYRFPFSNAMYYTLGVIENPWYTPPPEDEDED